MQKSCFAIKADDRKFRRGKSRRTTASPPESFVAQQFAGGNFAANSFTGEIFTKNVKKIYLCFFRATGQVRTTGGS